MVMVIDEMEEYPHIHGCYEMFNYLYDWFLTSSHPCIILNILNNSVQDWITY